jgi:hypothetical protein
MRVDVGTDYQARAMGGDIAGDTGTSTAIGATTMTDSGKSWTVNGYRGHAVYTGSCYGMVISNTATVLTIDKWYAPATPGGSAASTPSTGVYVITPGQGPAWWLGLSTDGTAPASGDTTLASELAGSGLGRSLCTYAHTGAATTYTLSKTFTSSDGTPRTINKVGVFYSSNGGQLVFETAVPSPPTLVSGDQLTVTETVTM